MRAKAVKVSVAKAKKAQGNAQSGGPSKAGGRAARTLKRRRPTKALRNLYTKLSEKSGVALDQVRSVYESLEKIVAAELLEKHAFSLPALVTFVRRELPARAASSKTICGRVVHIPERGAVRKIKAAPASSLKVSTGST